jgi:hypothetical protein
MRRFLAREAAAETSDEAGDEKKVRSARHRALVQLCRAVFNLNEFSYVD